MEIKEAASNEAAMKKKPKIMQRKRRQRRKRLKIRNETKAAAAAAALQYGGMALGESRRRNNGISRSEISAAAYRKWHQSMAEMKENSNNNYVEIMA